jgi:succinate dehydrogenase/fumarate reductase flavoprotein subunit
MSVESDKALSVNVDLLVIGGGTAGSVAAIKGKEALPGGEVLLLEKASVKRSGAIALGMDGVNNAVVPGMPPRSSMSKRSRWRMMAL